MAAALQFGLSFIGWRTLPNMAADLLLPYFHKTYQATLSRKPPAPGTPLYVQHRRWMYALVVFGYAMYNFYNAATSIGPNYYEMLGVNPAADEAGLKAGFRAFARKYHPDRAGPQYETLFMEVRDAYEALKDPVTRFAYDRFGPQALKWKQCKTMQEYLTHGMYQSTAYYVISFCALIFMNTISRRNHSFWNYILLAYTFAQEMLFLMGPSISDASIVAFSSLLFTDPVSPSKTGLLALLFPYRVAYQHITFFKSFSFLISSALYQVVPNLFPTSEEQWKQADLATFFALMNTTIRGLDQQAYEMIHTELNACHGKATDAPSLETSFTNVVACTPAETVMKLLTAEMEEVLVENALMAGQNEQLKKATEQAVRVRTRLEEARPQLELEETTRPKGPTRRTAPRPLEKLPSLVASPGRPGYTRARSVSLI